MSRRFPDLKLCPGATFDDLDPKQIEAYRQELDRRRPGSPLIRLSTEELLAQVGALGGKSKRRPTLAGILFFGREPQRFYPSLTVTFMHFAGSSTARADPEAPLYLDNREFSGILPAVIDAARSTLYDKLGKKAMVDGFVRQELLEYPEFAFREAIVNAVGHRDYSLEGSFVQIRLFADRLEIQSPGGLGGQLTVDNIVYEQFTRNPHVMGLLEDYGYVERRGLGVDQMIRSMREAGREPPVFEDRGTSFWVTLKGREGAPVISQSDVTRLGLNERQVAALEFLAARGRLTNREYQQEFDISERTALYDLQGLVEAGIVLPVSSGRGRYYILRD
jgi:ATP-dependent DNA helicase RecG